MGGAFLIFQLGPFGWRLPLEAAPVDAFEQHGLVVLGYDQLAGGGGDLVATTLQDAVQGALVLLLQTLLGEQRANDRRRAHAVHVLTKGRSPAVRRHTGIEWATVWRVQRAGAGAKGSLTDGSPVSANQTADELVRRLCS